MLHFTEVNEFPMPQLTELASNPDQLREVARADWAAPLEALSQKPWNGHLRRQILTAACDLLDNALKSHSVPVYPVLNEQNRVHTN